MKRALAWIASSLGVVTIAALLMWFFPSQTHTQLVLRKKSKAQADAAAAIARKPATEAQAKAPAPAVIPTAPPSPDQPLAKVACESKLATSFEVPQELCHEKVLTLRQTIEHRLQVLESWGIKLDMSTCTATDPNGESSTIESIIPDAAEMTAIIMAKKLSFTWEGEAYTGNRFNRANAVAICSVYKCMQYWSANPSEIPPPNHLHNYVYFDVDSGKPRESLIAGAFLQAMAVISPKP